MRHIALEVVRIRFESVRHQARMMLDAGPAHLSERIRNMCSEDDPEELQELYADELQQIEELALESIPLILVRAYQELETTAKSTLRRLGSSVDQWQKTAVQLITGNSSAEFGPSGWDQVDDAHDVEIVRCLTNAYKHSGVWITPDQSQHQKIISHFGLRVPQYAQGRGPVHLRIPWQRVHLHTDEYANPDRDPDLIDACHDLAVRFARLTPESS